MKHTLFFKFPVGYILFCILGFVIISTFTTSYTYSYVQEQEADHLYREAKHIASNYASNYYQSHMTLEDVQEHLIIVNTYLNASVWITNSTGKILIASEPSTQNMQINGFDITTFGTKYYQTGIFFHTLEQDHLSVYAPIIIDYKLCGYVLIHKPLSLITYLGDGFLNISYFSLAIISLVAFLLFVTFIYMVYIPIYKITKAAAAYGNGNFDTKLQIHSNDEIGYIAASLNYMASELNTLEEDQRKFIANISHDFRSPLTSIKGYIEAIMDGTIPYEMQDKYLNIILVETARLNKLTQSMLELNKYGSHGSLLDISNFDINKIIKMTIQSFEGTCRSKKIFFELILSGETLFVQADMSKLQQVLYNLVDNAIKFSHPDSIITIETTERNGKVFVSVKDNGIGIPKDCIKKIWERFYKTDTSRGKDKTGTGLGLAIVKEIIQAHNENINVISTEGVGTEFIFTLPLTDE